MPPKAKKAVVSITRVLKQTRADQSPLSLASTSASSRPAKGEGKSKAAAKSKAKICAETRAPETPMPTINPAASPSGKAAVGGKCETVSETVPATSSHALHDVPA